MTRFEQLRVWQRARTLVTEVNDLVKRWRDDAGLGNQMRRAAISIASNIAEGANRHGDADLRRFLQIARGSCHELKAQLYLARDLGTLTTERFSHLYDTVDHVTAMIHRFVRRVESTA